MDVDREKSPEGFKRPGINRAEARRLRRDDPCSESPIPSNHILSQNLIYYNHCS